MIIDNQTFRLDGVSLATATTLAQLGTPGTAGHTVDLGAARDVAAPRIWISVYTAAATLAVATTPGNLTIWVCSDDSTTMGAAATRHAAISYYLTDTALATGTFLGAACIGLAGDGRPFEQYLGLMQDAEQTLAATTALDVVATFEPPKQLATADGRFTAS